MVQARLMAAALGVVATFCINGSGFAADQIKVAIGGRGVGETFVTEVGKNAGFFQKQNLDPDVFYTDGGGETQQAVIAGSAQIGVASGFLGAIGVFAKGAPVRIIGNSYTGGAQVFWFVRADSPVKTPQDLAGKTIGYSTNGSSTHAGILALQKHYNVNWKAVATGSGAATMTAVMSGQVDAGWAGAPFGVAELEAGKIRLIMKSGDAPEFDKQTSRVIIANANELTSHPDVITRFMRGYREALNWIYTPDGIKAYAQFAHLSEGTAKRALAEFLPFSATNPDRISGIDEVMADAITFKFITTPLSKQQLAELIQIPERHQ